ncbi:MAG: AAA family ATPase, partial [Flavobacteriales bacterium]|nr:AAA family ATPase [Flavobacteriales bacterium]
MIISRLILKNWKNFQHVEVDLNYRTFIVGANASGKSNLLDAILFIRDLVKQPGGGLQYAVGSVRGGVSKIRCLAARKDPEVSIEVHLSESPGEDVEWKYRVGFKHAGGGIVKHQAKITSEEVWHKNKLILQRKASDKGEDPEKLLY